jgi:hypothetical protein
MEAVNNRAKSSFRWSWFDAVWLLLYVAMIFVLVTTLEQSRHYALEDFSTSQAQAEWTQWRDDVAQQSEKAGPVSRRTPRSEQPPTLVLMRDHYRVVLIGSILMSSVLFAAFMFFCRAIFARP